MVAYRKNFGQNELLGETDLKNFAAGFIIYALSTWIQLETLRVSSYPNEKMRFKFYKTVIHNL